MKNVGNLLMMVLFTTFFSVASGFIGLLIGGIFCLCGASSDFLYASAHSGIAAGAIIGFLSSCVVMVEDLFKSWKVSRVKMVSLIAGMASHSRCDKEARQKLMAQIFAHFKIRNQAERAALLETFESTFKACPSPRQICEDAQNLSAARFYYTPNRRLFLYNLLWNLAASKKTLSKGTESLLHDLTMYLHVSPDYFDEYLRKCQS